MARFGTGLIVRDTNGNTLAKVEDLGVTVTVATAHDDRPRISDNGEWLVVTVTVVEGDA